MQGLGPHSDWFVAGGQGLDGEKFLVTPVPSSQEVTLLFSAQGSGLELGLCSEVTMRPVLVSQGTHLAEGKGGAQST